MPTSLEGKVAVITGAASGMGRQFALSFTEAGATAVVVADITETPREGGESTVDAVRALGGQAVFVRTDVTRLGDLEAAVAAAEQFGGIDIMVNNAGIFSHTPLLTAEEETYDRMMDINVKGTYFGAKYAASAMVAAGRGGVIINMASIAGIQGGPGFSVYSTSKGAVRLLTYALAGELGEHDIRVLAIHPGVIDTSMTQTDVPIGDEVLRVIPAGRKGTAEDVARVVTWAASDEAGYVSGTSLVVDGAQTRVM
ncbi:SDR family NAD(P)-dependent oxidoreductase [Nocardioides alcanivorans]|uniref:SDR family NAD(P)-dependent oxidoreductase n=1 Tax=Nocardioides alcanivorans TaxID=2897352 RepID=UPI001F449788|nr:SDR family oxidoreductase [Nocardioides alcanivorans]